MVLTIEPPIVKHTQEVIEAMLSSNSVQLQVIPSDESIQMISDDGPFVKRDDFNLSWEIVYHDEFQIHF